jgi:hypothetical protein
MGLEQEEEGPDTAAAAGESNEEFDLLLVPDDQLTPEQRKVKRRQQLLKAGRDARARAKAVKEQKERDKVGCADVFAFQTISSAVRAAGGKFPMLGHGCTSRCTLLGHLCNVGTHW